jgi:NAD(P)-dependent dehydrogenase (short-subunit alcohol dehydrogenase family)
VTTPLLETAIAESPDPIAARQRFLDAHPIARLGTAEEIASAIVFLLSDEADFISGALLSVDGAYVAQ